MTILLTASAYVAATLSGVVGMAGGALLLGLMLLIGVDPKTAIPIHAFVQLISNGTRIFAHIKRVRWRPFLFFILPAAPGPILGLWLLDHLEESTVKIFMGVVILLAAWMPRKGFEKIPEHTSFVIAGVIGGSLGVVVGAVGPLIAPFFLRGGFDRYQIIATKALCQAYLHVLKIVAFASVGFAFADNLDPMLPMAAAAIAGTYTGKWLLGKISEQEFRWIYKYVLTVLALRLCLFA